MGPSCCSSEFVFVPPGGSLLRVVVGFSDPAEALSLSRVLGHSGQGNFLDLWVYPEIPFVPIVGWGVVLGFLPAQKVLTRGRRLLELTLIPGPWPRKGTPRRVGRVPPSQFGTGVGQGFRTAQKVLT